MAINPLLRILEKAVTAVRLTVPFKVVKNKYLPASALPPTEIIA